MDHDALSPAQQQLYSAVWRKNLPEAQKAIADGANIHHLYANNRNIAHVAAWFNKAEILLFVMEKGVDVDALDALGQTPLSLAVQNDAFASFKVLARADRLQKALGASAEQVPSGKAPSKFDPSKTSVLHLLARTGKMEWLDWVNKNSLVKDWTQIGPKTAYTLAHEAALAEQWKVLPWLYARGIDPSVSYSSVTAMPSSPEPSVNEILQKIPGGLRFARTPKP